MARAVRFDDYGGVDVLEVRDVEPPEPGPGQVLVEVRAAGINPGEDKIRSGALHEMWPSTFPSGEGSDFAGVVTTLGEGAHGVAVGDEVIGWTDERGSHAELVVVPAEHLTPKPDSMSWEVAGALFVVGTTAYAAVHAVGASADDNIVVAAAAGGVGSVTVQLARRAGATVIGLASESNHAWLSGHGVVPVAYGDGVAERIREAAPRGVDALIDLAGGGYVALGLELGVAPDRIDTIVDYAAVREHGVKSEGSAAAARPEVLAELAGMIAAGELEIPIARTYPLDEVRDAYRDLAQGHTRGKIVLVP
jgi:NADPH:quinone reductase-like Zn-dependent oxidoreductase